MPFLPPVGRAMLEHTCMRAHIQHTYTQHTGFMGELVPPNRKALAVYPLFLFYTSIGWLILIAAKRS